MTLTKNIIYCGQSQVLACDEKCTKAWGINSRPRVQLDPNDVDDYAYLADGECEEAPADPGTYEGGHGKPTSDMKLESKWCARECERSVMVGPNEKIELLDFSQRRFNVAPHTRETVETEIMVWRVKTGDQMLMPDDKTWVTVEYISRIKEDGRLFLAHVEGGFSQCEPHHLKKVRRK